MNANYKKFILIILGILIMTLSFNNNIFVRNSIERLVFKFYQIDSENLVIGAIIRDRSNLNNSGYGLQLIEDVSLLNYKEYNRLLQENIVVQTIDYKSQVGVQGRVFSFLYNKLNVSIEILHLICSLLLAIVLITICYLLKIKYGKLFAIIFFFVFTLSPWITRFAKNLYWVEFTWFLPLMLCLLLDKTKKPLYLPLIFIAVLFKCLCGYEYLSTILLTSITFFIVDFIIEKEKRKEVFRIIICVGLISVLAFCTALCIHASIRENGNILQGIKTIIKEDVMRRTIGTNVENIKDIQTKKSMEASYYTVIQKYYNFTTDVVIGIRKSAFPILCIGSLLIVISNIIRNKENSLRDFCFYILFWLGTISWFVLGKAHSYVHTHMNYVLWYFGYIQMVIYIIIKQIIEIIEKIKNIKKGRIK